MRALVLTVKDKQVSATVQDLSETDLPKTDLSEGELLLEVEASGFNYKDGMAIKGLGGLVREYPHVPGIDLAGKVIECADGSFALGDRVIVTGFRMGEWHWGGFAERARIPKSSYAVKMPASLSSSAAMACGTAAMTAQLAIARLDEVGVNKDSGRILVTGASGGVGSFAVMFLARAGFEVTASSGSDNESYLKSLGASEVISREEFAEPLDPRKPLEKTRWAGVIDSVGGAPLARVIAQTNVSGAIASIGLTAGIALSGTILPFLLRGVSILGVDSAMYPSEKRATLWQRIADAFSDSDYKAIAHEHGLDELTGLAEQILAGKIRGRAVINPKK